jgi:hypothetical protein
VAVASHREGRVLVPCKIGDYLHRHAVEEEERDVCVPEVVDAKRWLATYLECLGAGPSFS